MMVGSPNIMKILGIREWAAQGGMTAFTIALWLGDQLSACETPKHYKRPVSFAMGHPIS
jgi:hypothetical protein